MLFMIYFLFEGDRTTIEHHSLISNKLILNKGLLLFPE